MEDRHSCRRMQCVDEIRANRRHSTYDQEQCCASPRISDESSSQSAVVGKRTLCASPATRGGCGDSLAYRGLACNSSADLDIRRSCNRAGLRRGGAVWLAAIPVVATLCVGSGCFRPVAADREILTASSFHGQDKPGSRLQKEFWNMEIPQLRGSVPGTMEVLDGDSWTSGPSDSFGADSCSRADSPNSDGGEGRARSPSLESSGNAPRGRKRTAPESKVCRHVEGCDKWANFGDETEHVPLFCKQHKQPWHCNVVSRRCTSPGCGKRPVFGDPQDRVRRFCRQHKLEHHVDVANKRCRFPHCRKHPIFGEIAPDLLKPDETDRSSGSDEDAKTQPAEAKYCADHKGPQHVDVRHKRCEQGGCAKLSSFADPGSRSPRFCTSHKLPGQIYVLAAACAEEGCLRRPSFAFVAGGWDQRCAKHRLPGQLRGRSLSALHRDKAAVFNNTATPPPPVFQVVAAFPGAGATGPARGRLEHGPRRPLLCNQT